jgi:N-acetylglutamate synthase-like GNAT family acetyltransferase
MNTDSKNLVYRKLCCNDTDLFIKLRLDFIYEFHKDVGETEKDKLKISLRNYFESHIGNNDFIGVICEYNGKIISAAYLIIGEWPANRTFINGKIGTILNVYTYPKYRKNGIGTNVIKKIIEEAKEQNVSIINLLATEDGENVYKKLGFMETEDKSMRLKLQNI